MQQHRTYACPKCKATKTIYQPLGMSDADFISWLSAAIFCGVRDCTGYAIPTWKSVATPNA